MSLSKPKPPKEDPASIALRERQLEQLAKLDDEENEKVKRLLLSTRGTQSYRGAPALRNSPGNTRAPVVKSSGRGMFDGPRGVRR